MQILKPTTTKRFIITTRGKQQIELHSRRSRLLLLLPDFFSPESASPKPKSVQVACTDHVGHQANFLRKPLAGPIKLCIYECVCNYVHTYIHIMYAMSKKLQICRARCTQS